MYIYGFQEIECLRSLGGLVLPLAGGMPKGFSFPSFLETEFMNDFLGNGGLSMEAVELGEFGMLLMVVVDDFLSFSFSNSLSFIFILRSSSFKSWFSRFSLESSSL